METGTRRRRRGSGMECWKVRLTNRVHGVRQSSVNVSASVSGDRFISGGF